MSNTPNPSAVVVPGAPPAPDATAPDVQNQLAALQSQLQELSQSVAQRDALIERYKLELGTRSAPPIAAPADPTSGYSDDNKQFVQYIAQKEIDRTIRSLSLKAQVQQAVGTDADITKAATAEYQRLQTDPAWQGLPEEVLMANAAANAKANVLAARNTTLQAELTKRAGGNPPAPPTLPGTSVVNVNAPLEGTDPDADLKEYWAQPESQALWRSMLRAAGNEAVPWDSEELVRPTVNSPLVKAKDFARRIATRAVRTGVTVVPDSALAAAARAGR